MCKKSLIIPCHTDKRCFNLIFVPTYGGGMEIFMIHYNSRDKKCKSPFGAIPVSATVTFTVFCDNISMCYLTTQNSSHKMIKTKDGFTLDINFKESGLVFYNFMLISEQGIKFFINSSESGKGIFSLIKENSYQLTVYENFYKTPKWFKEGIAYQIFPDRFRISGNIIKAKKDSFYYENTNTVPNYIKKGNEIEKWDFFGGNLKGITEKLPYLKNLNVSVIYLNPIFEANSNHRYNTGNYLKIDPVLGSEEDFDNLISECDKLGIKVILDGVFNHTGADSIYFNKFGSYNSCGAYQSKESPYYSWFKFKNYPNEYESWWGVLDLPATNKENPEYVSFIITGENSVIKKWTNKKIGGWRLDVADELPDSFLEHLYKTVKDCNKNDVVIGEVWEDASNKIAYGSLKNYFTKPQLDSVMNYPFRDNLIAFLKKDINAETLKFRFDEQMENYPFERYMSNFNFLGTHDIERIKTVLSDINSENLLALIKMSVMCLFFYPGIPCIYYGDERGLEGEKDPDNRRFFPWKNENKEIFDIYKKSSDLRNNSDALKTGKTIFDSFGNDVFGIIRYTFSETKALYINRSEKTISFYSEFLNQNISVKKHNLIII